jgi:hypothetical protein
MIESAQAPLRPLIEAWVHCRRHRQEVGHWPNPLRPRSFNDHVLRTLILRRDPLHARVSDKLALRAVVRERMGEDLCVPLLGAWDDAAALARDWDGLPEAFILKPNHASGWLHVVRDRAAADRHWVVAQARWWLENSFYDRSREWVYRRIRPQVLAEPLLPAPPGEDAPRDYRCFTFGGRVAMLRVLGARAGRVLALNCDRDGRPLPVRLNDLPQDPAPPPSPEARQALVAVAERLAAGTAFLRVDLYLDRGRVLVGELTPFPNAGALPIRPAAWDLWLGAVWRAARRGDAWPAPPG